MEENMRKLYEIKVEKIIKNLERNNMRGVYLKNKGELTSFFDKNIKTNETVSTGGSTTISELDIISYLKTRDIVFLDRYEKGLSSEEKEELYRNSLLSDSYITSTNAITEKGYLYNVDGTGNRVAAMIYGPKKVFVIAGVNKIVYDTEEAIKRVRSVAAPANAIRLNLNTPCTKTGECMDCQVDDRICNEYTLIKRQNKKDRITVIFLPENLGY